MTKTYFIWLMIHFAVWFLIFTEGTFMIDEMRLISMCLYFILLFSVPLFREKPIVQLLLFCIQTLTTVVIFYPIYYELNLSVLLIHLLLIAEAVYYLSRLRSLMVAGIQLGCLLFLVFVADISISELLWGSMLYLLSIFALFYFQTIHKRMQEVQVKNDTLLDEYRKMKRQLVTEEEQVRQDERMMIGHEIHDSVGHKLTALLMQFEAFRLTAPEQDKEKIEKLKGLAQQSLEETRRAVKSFKQKEVGGLQGVIQLIRKLEMESFMKVNFSVKHGAFAAPITGEQSFAIYRAVQEALTNIMKHSSTRSAQVMFESPGGSIFRFEVVNLAPPNSFFQEGYGLKAMRERLEQVGGSLDIIHDERQFVVRGNIRLIERRG
ncbi:sensor histidine kinase [Halalkalibacter sp. APA_J-10(15)]|uniref:sensor histidine kinase n=1 Tax=Halalkalibacter sp. APA_J-10(15) TaxID=2933805 RepID=UPI001FF539B9|nr:sensor histidine kinase [Halalkalibacter sp. APA_J-10(15)]MCK0471671.1 sensor histidine kinase [Halalkalibacter sp. APA_J-10(15)]